VDVMFISDSPSSKEMLNPLAFIGPEKKLLDDVLQEVCPDKSIAYTYLVRGWPVDLSKSKYYANQPDTLVKNLPEKELRWLKSQPLNNHPQKKSILENCLKFLNNDIQKLRPKLLIFLGNAVKEALIPNEKKSMLQLQNSYRDYSGCTVRFLPSITSVLKNPSSKKSWQKQLKAVLSNKIFEPDNNLASQIYVVKNLNEAIEYIESLKNTHNDISFDIETHNLNKRYGNKIATLQFSETLNSSTVIPYNHKDSPFLPDEIEILRTHLYDLFRHPNKIRSWIGHNLKFECNVLSSVIGTPLLSAPMFDTMVGAFMLDENRAERVADFKYGIFSLKQLALDYLNFDGYNKGILDVRSEGNLYQLDLQQLAEYGGMDTIVTKRLGLSLIEDAKEQNFIRQFLNLMYYHYTPLILLFSNIEQNGFYVDKDNLKKLTQRDSLMLKAIDDIVADLKNIPEAQRANELLLTQKNPRLNILGKKPWVFDFSKQGHPQALFFNVCGLPTGKIGKSGLASVDKDWQKTHKDHPLVKHYMEWSSMRHLYDTFVTTLYDRIDPQKETLDSNTDCCIRPNFNLIGTVTGRASSDDPNLQNIPRSDTPAKKSIKDIFRALPGHYLVQLDYKANEIRWVGILAQDDNLAKAIKQGKQYMEEYRLNPSEELLLKAETYGDIHKQTASMVFDKPLENVTKDERQISKAVIFAILYGSSIKAVAESMNKSIEEVDRWFNLFYERYPQIAQWKRKTERMAQQYGYVETANGRRRRFPIFNLFKDAQGNFSDNLVPSDYKGEIGSALRQSVNSPIQGVASDYGMCGGALFNKYIRDYNKLWKICNAVHDSCVFQVPYNDLEEALEQADYWFTTGVMDYMAEVFDINFNLPLEVDFEIGLSWGSLLKWNFNKEELRVIKEKLKTVV
jgi:DNA polymerase I-like protein with 3'-5' exonuclease and polymerase domains/uracil-DNA glycosylase